MTLKGEPCTGMANMFQAISVHGKSQKTRGGRGWLVGSELVLSLAPRDHVSGEVLLRKHVDPCRILKQGLSYRTSVLLD